MNSSQRLYVLCLSVLLVLIFFSLSFFMPIQYYFVPVPYIHPNEVRSWMYITMFLLPAAIGLGLVLFSCGKTTSAIEQFLQAKILPSYKPICFLVISTYFCLVFLTHTFYLLDSPISDDETAVLFGSRVLANFQFLADINTDVFYNPFFYYAQDGVTSFDFFGVLLLSAVAEFLGVYNEFYAFIAIVPLVLMFKTIHKSLGSIQWGFLGLFMLMFSPMFFGMSITNHSQILVRCIYAVMLTLFWINFDDIQRKSWFYLAFIYGASYCIRPYELATMGLPFAGYYAYKTILEKQHKRLLIATSLFAIPIILSGIYKYQVTGQAILPVRHMMEGYYNQEQASLDLILKRFAKNFSREFFLQVLYVFSPLVFIPFFIAIYKDLKSRLVFAGIIACFLVGFFHDIPSIHVGGPHHFALLVFPILLLTVYGLKIMASHPKKITSSYQIAFVIFFIGLMPNLMAINLHIKAMRGTPEIRRTFLSFADNQLVKIKAEKGIKSKGKNIILVPPYHSVVNHFISLRKKIGFVFHWPLPDPNFTQDTIYGLKAKADIDNLRNEFPNRYIFELQLVHENPGMKIILVSQPG